MRKCVVVIVLLSFLLSALTGCNRTNGTITSLTSDISSNNEETGLFKIEVGNDSSDYYVCKELDYVLKDPVKKTIAYGGLISDSSVWLLVLAETENAFFYLEQFDLDGNKLREIKLAEYSEIDINAIPFLFEVDNTLCIVSDNFPSGIVVNRVDLTSFEVSSFSIQIPDALYGTLLGFRDGVFYVKTGNSQGEVRCFGYDIVSGESKFETNPDLDAQYFIWRENDIYQLNRSDDSKTYHIFSTGQKIEDYGVTCLPSEYGEIIFLHNSQYFINNDGIWTIDEKNSVWENLIVWSNTEMSKTDNAYDQYTLSKSGDRFLACGRNAYNVSLFTLGKDPGEGKQVLKLWGSYIDDEVLNAISIFNSTNQHYTIESYEYRDLVDPDDYEDKDGWTDSRKYDEAVFEYLWKSIRKGDGPDILLRDAEYSGENRSDSRYYEYGDLFLDLLPLWNDEDEDWKDQFYPNLLQLMKNGKSLYAVPYKFRIASYVSKDQSILDIQPTYSAWLSYLEDNADGRVLCQMTGPEFLRKCLLYDLGAFVDTESNKADFSCQEFKDMLTLSKKYLLSQAEQDNNKERESILDEYYIGGGDLNEIVTGRTYENKALYKLLSKIGGIGRFVPESIAITSNCHAVDGAWDFIKLILSDEMQEFNMRREDSDNISLFDMPVRVNSMDYLLDFYTHPKQHEAYWISVNESDDNFSIDSIRPITEENAKGIMDYVSSIDYISYSDSEIVDIIMEETAPYFAGQKTQDEVIRIISDRVQTVLNERR